MDEPSSEIAFTGRVVEGSAISKIEPWFWDWWAFRMELYPLSHHYEVRILDGRLAVPVGEIASAISRGGIPHQRLALPRSCYDASLLRVDNGVAPAPLRFLQRQLTTVSLATQVSEGEFVVLDGRKRAMRLFDLGIGGIEAVVFSIEDAREYIRDIGGMTKREKEVLKRMMESPLLSRGESYGPLKDQVMKPGDVIWSEVPDVEVVIRKGKNKGKSKEKEGRTERVGAKELLFAYLMVAARMVLERAEQAHAAKGTPNRPPGQFHKEGYLSGVTTTEADKPIQAYFKLSVGTINRNHKESMKIIEEYERTNFFGRISPISTWKTLSDDAMGRKFVYLSRAHACADWAASALKKKGQIERKGIGYDHVHGELVGQLSDAARRHLGLRGKIEVAQDTGINVIDFYRDDVRNWELVEWFARSYFIVGGKWPPLKRRSIAEQFLNWVAINATLPGDMETDEGHPLWNDVMLQCWRLLFNTLDNLPAGAVKSSPAPDTNPTGTDRIRNAFERCFRDCYEIVIDSAEIDLGPGRVMSPR